MSLLRYWEAWAAQAVRAASRLWGLWLGLETRDDEVEDGLPPGLRRRARQAVWRLRQAYDEAAETGAFEDLMAAFRRLAPESGEIKTALILWIHLLETLIQEAENQYGATPGLGELKAEQVKAAMLYLLLQEDIKIPNLPGWITPLVLEFGTEWLIDSIVTLLNQNDLWERRTAAPRRRIGIVSRLLRWLALLASWARRSALFLRLGNWLEGLSRRAVLASHPLEPAVKAAADDLLDSGVLDIRRGIRRAAELIGWIRGHRRQVVALVELVSVAVQEAEEFLDMPGPEKKVYAREVVLALLSEEGIIGPPDGLGYLITEWILDWAIDAVVSLFNRRSLFQHSTRRSTA